MTAVARLRRIRLLLWVFVIGLVLSGATALPLEVEVRLLLRAMAGYLPAALTPPGLVAWITRVHEALVVGYGHYPFLAYGTDWLAFGHFVIALAFLGPLRDPVRNAWVLDWAMLACVLVVPFALLAGPVRGVPFGWRLIDCCFGVFGLVPLWFCRRDIRELAKLGPTAPT